MLRAARPEAVRSAVVPAARFPEDFGGQLRIEMSDSKDRPVVAANGRLGEYIWMGTRDLHGLYQMEGSRFTPDAREEYRLRFSYEPDPRLAGYKGFILIQYGRGSPWIPYPDQE